MSQACVTGQASPHSQILSLDHQPTGFQWWAKPSGAGLLLPFPATWPLSTLCPSEQLPWPACWAQRACHRRASSTVCSASAQEMWKGCFLIILNEPMHLRETAAHLPAFLLSEKGKFVHAFDNGSAEGRVCPHLPKSYLTQWFCVMQLICNIILQFWLGFSKILLIKLLPLSMHS